MKYVSKVHSFLLFMSKVDGRISHSRTVNNNMLYNKLNYLPMCHILKGNCFGPLSKIIRSNQHEAMSL
jgi:hypothetical protein